MRGGCGFVTRQALLSRARGLRDWSMRSPRIRAATPRPTAGQTPPLNSSSGPDRQECRTQRDVEMAQTTKLQGHDPNHVARQRSVQEAKTGGDKWPLNTPAVTHSPAGQVQTGAAQERREETTERKPLGQVHRVQRTPCKTHNRHKRASAAERGGKALQLDQEAEPSRLPTEEEDTGGVTEGPAEQSSSRGGTRACTQVR